MRSFVYACCTGDDRYIISGPSETFGNLQSSFESVVVSGLKFSFFFSLPTDSHLYVFAAEHARRTGTVVDIDQYRKQVLSEQ